MAACIHVQMAACALSAAALSAAPAAAEPWTPPELDAIHNRGFQWSTIGALNNGAIPAGTGNTVDGRGSVGYEYRLARTEITNTQWAEYNRAYSQYVIFQADLGFTGVGVVPIGSDPTNIEDYRPYSGWENASANVSWYHAARYVNWLHNNKVNERWAFETGVYDTSKFGFNPDGTLSDPPRAAGARYWIPSLDEWLKGAHYDPNKHGPGQEGWWHYPTTMDTAPLQGTPEEGGQTSAGSRLGIPFPDEGGPIPIVGQYEDITSPWGLWDTSGGYSEWIEDINTTAGSTHYAEGSGVDDFFGFYDTLRNVDSSSPSSNFYFTLRVASAVPSPGLLPIGALLLGFAITRRENRRQPCRGESCS